ncbi:uncharacterized protein YALI1_E23461g [Yarrowia lipolytica]|uniref:Uncharacterized protein n=1 Tax=Yarrowia lipolytica TaxID=4952 RepID=A0A1D8NJ52_YARLL|nr:hypothetical protein YALI1_E23461g [Yarrowia lipolytica]
MTESRASGTGTHYFKSCTCTCTCTALALALTLCLSLNSNMRKTHLSTLPEPVKGLYYSLGCRIERGPPTQGGSRRPKV